MQYRTRNLINRLDVHERSLCSREASLRKGRRVPSRGTASPPRPQDAYQLLLTHYTRIAMDMHARERPGDVTAYLFLHSVQLCAPTDHNVTSFARSFANTPHATLGFDSITS